MFEMANKIYFSNEKAITAEELSRIFLASGIQHRPVSDLKRLNTMLENSNMLWTAWDDSKLVGVARALTDYSYACYLSDLAVDASYQKQGIGHTLIQKVREEIGPDVSLLLLSAPSAIAYYQKNQFKHVNNAFLIKRRPF